MAADGAWAGFSQEELRRLRGLRPGGGRGGPGGTRGGSEGVLGEARGVPEGVLGEARGSLRGSWGARGRPQRLGGAGG